MKTLEVGQDIVLTNYLGTVKGLKNGAIGTITSNNSQLDMFFAKFHGFNGEIPVYPGECDLAPAPASSAEPVADAGDSGYSELIDELNGRIKALERDNDKAKAREKMCKHSVELHEEQYHQAKDNATLLYRELRLHIGREDLNTLQKRLNGNTNEYDKLMSDASRGREALADNARLETALAAANANAAHKEEIAVMLQERIIELAQALGNIRGDADFALRFSKQATAASADGSGSESEVGS